MGISTAIPKWGLTKNLKTTIPLYIAPKKAKNDQLLGRNLQI
jgi:hypothetical protein